jgi:ribosomal-protein-alanine N-acetyltransferase
VKAPEQVESERLVLRRPRMTDADAIFTRYASDPEVTRYMAFPTHKSVADAHVFLAMSEAQWDQWPAGPYLVHAREDGRLLGGSGLHFETAQRAMTGYVFAKDAWGQGYASEALRAIVGVAPQTGVERLYAICHVDHRPSWKVLEKCGFVREGILRRYAEFPNLTPGHFSDVFCYATILDV